MSALRASGPGRPSPPIWPCTTRGFPCLRCCHRSGGLLPHLFTLAKRGHQKRRAGGFASCLSSRCCGQSAKADSPRFRAGGLFSVALSVAGPRDSLSLVTRTKPPGVTRRVALRLVALRLRAAVSGLSSRSAALRRLNRRSPDLPASLIIHGLGFADGLLAFRCQCIEIAASCHQQAFPLKLFNRVEHFLAFRRVIARRFKHDVQIQSVSLHLFEHLQDTLRQRLHRSPRLFHADQSFELAFGEDSHAQLFRLVVFRSRLRADHHVIRLLAY